MELNIGYLNNTRHFHMEESRLPFDFPTEYTVNYIPSEIYSTGALRNGSLDLIMLPLHMSPLDLEDDIAIFALSPRTAPEDILLLRKEFTDLNQDFLTQKGALVWVENQLQALQLNDYRPDLKIELRNTVQMADDTNAWSAAIIWAGAFKEEIYPAETYLTRKLLPTEFPGAAGRGCYALLGLKANMSLRRKIKDLHCSEVASCTNIERSVAKHLALNPGDHAGIYCYQDSNHFYHCNAFLYRKENMSFKRHHCSSATSAGFTDLIIAGLA